MKTLIISPKNDFRLQILLSPLASLGEVGRLKEKDDDSIKEFDADLIISDCNIGIDIEKVKSLPPSISLENYKKPKKDSRKYCDIAYLGNPTDMDMVFSDLFSIGKSVRVFYHNPSPSPVYAGMVSVKEVFEIYHNAEICPIPPNDLGYRKLDILVSEGNPVDFVSKASFLKICKIPPKRPISQIDKILEKDTNFDRVIKLLKDLNKKKEASQLMEIKRDWCNSI